ncbi:22900_t:CDS:2, partial [Entrophospora sp. SA101]
MPLIKQLEDILEKRKDRNLLRTLVAKDLNQIDFSSNDFLGLSRNQQLKQLYISEILNLPTDEPLLGSTGSRLLDGNSQSADALDDYLAAFHRAESALTFTSGFDANVGFFGSVPQPGDAIIMDEFIHASVHEGGLYSMDGDVAPLKEIVEISRPYNNAHSTGVYGRQGRGIVNELGLEDQVFARLHTFGKALASNGGAILGPKVLKSYLLNYARPLIFSTFLPYNNLIGIKCAYKIMSSELGDQLRKNLKRLIVLFKSTIKLPSHMLLSSNSQIQGIIIPGNENVVFLSRLLQKSGYNVKAVRSPTVPIGKERIRICIHADNTEDQIKSLVKIIEENTY